MTDQTQERLNSLPVSLSLIEHWKWFASGVGLFHSHDWRLHLLSQL